MSSRAAEEADRRPSSSSTTCCSRSRPSRSRRRRPSCTRSTRSAPPSGVYDKWVQEQLRRAARAAPGALRQDRAQRRSGRCDPLSARTVRRRCSRWRARRCRLRDVSSDGGSADPATRQRRRPQRRDAERAAAGDGGRAPAPRSRARRRSTRPRSAPSTTRSQRLARRPHRRSRARLQGAGAVQPRARRPARQPGPDLSPGRQAARGGEPRSRRPCKLSPRAAGLPEPARHHLSPAGRVRQGARRIREGDRARRRATPRRCSTSASCTTCTCGDAPRALELYDRYLALSPAGDADRHQMGRRPEEPQAAHDHA